MPAFFILVVLGAMLLWLCCSFIFAPLGRFVSKLITDAKDVMDKEDPIEDSNEKKEST